jgi:hypothetical protein
MNHSNRPIHANLCVSVMRQLFSSVASVIILMLAWCASSPAQSYSIDWYKIAAGGGSSTNAQFTLSGTIGQAEAGGPLSGGAYAVSGGFWTVSTVPTTGAPLLRIALTPTNTAIVSWPSSSSGFSLQVTTNLSAAAWIAPAESINDDGTQKFIIVNPPAGNRFYRLSNP